MPETCPVFSLTAQKVDEHLCLAPGVVNNLNRGTYMCKPVQVVGDISLEWVPVGESAMEPRAVLGQVGGASLKETNYQLEDAWMLKVLWRHLPLL